MEKLTEKQKRQIKERFVELRMRLQALLGARNPWEKAELGKNRDWRKIADMIFEVLQANPYVAEPKIDLTGRMKKLQYPDCFVCEIMEKKCFIWDGDAKHRDCPELWFKGFCIADPENDFNDVGKCGLYKRQIMHKLGLMRLALAIAESKPDAPAKADITRYCKNCCSAYSRCCSANSLYEQYLICEEALENHLKETIGYVDEIIRRCC